MYSEILIRFGELSLKGKNKMQFVKRLEKNIIALTKSKPTVFYDYMLLPYSIENMENLKYVFGIYSYSPVLKIKGNDLSLIEKTIIKVTENLKDVSIKVSTKRRNKKFPMSSEDVSKHLAGIIFANNNANLSVDLTNPDVKIEIDIYEKEVRIFTSRVLGLGGLPTGINGNVLHLISGGIDSPVAALEMMKRGIHVDFLNFITPPHTDEKTIEKTNKLIEILMKYQGNARLYRSNFTNLMNLIGLTSNQAYKINLMRRSFYRIANFIALRDGYQGLSNGENLGQVASQTLESINTIASQATLPIYRPLLTYDKSEIIEKAKRIATYDISVLKAVESCEFFAPRKPVTKPKIDKAEELEDELSSLKEYEDQAISSIEIIKF